MRKYFRAAGSVRTAIAAILGGTMAVQVPTALAQQADDDLDEVVVTGSRIARRDLAAASPIVTVEAQAFDESSTIGVETILNQLPQFVPANTQFLAADIQPGSTNTVGASSVNMRGLGTNRTLVLIDGRRAQPANASLVIDTNTIPSSAIESVEIISGGASAVYGADAMGGVTNFKIKDNFQGAVLDARGGVTEAGDGEEYRLSALLGANLGDGRGNAMLGVEWTERKLARWHERAFFREELYDTTTAGFRVLSRFNAPGYEPVAGNQPSQDAANALFPGRVADIPRGGVFLFNEDNSIFRLEQNGIGFNGPVGEGQYKVVGGTLRENELDTWLSSPLERYSMFARARYDLGRGVSAFTRASFVNTEVHSSRQRGAPIYSGFAAAVPYGPQVYAPSVDELGNTRPEYLDGGALGLSGCPAVGGCPTSLVWPVPQDLATLLDSRGPNVLSTTQFDPSTGAPLVTAGVGSNWNLGLVPLFLPLRTTENRTQLYQVLAGLEGRLGLGDWTWEAYFTHGETHTTAAYGGNVSTQRWADLIASPNYGRNASFADGTVTCTSGIPIFERFEVTQDCKDAVVVNTVDRTDLVQDVLEANLQGGLFSLPAGQVRAAAGVSYRRNEFSFTPDPARDVNNTIDVPAGVFRASWTGGETRVKEVYGELLLPVLRDLPLARSLELELGARHSSYNPGKSVPTYKALVNWAPVDSLRIRGGYQLANRAPNIDELFRGVTNTVAVGIDPCLSAGTGSVSWGNVATNTTNRAQIQQLCSAIIGSGSSDFDADPDNYAFGSGVAAEIAVSSGNPDLKSEKGRTWTAGFVLTSPFSHAAFNNMSLSVDWYQAKISDAIAAVSNTTAYELCFNRNGVSNPTYSLDDPNGMCRRIERDEVSGARVRTFTPFANLGRLETSGIDLSFAWRAPLADLGMESLPGALSLNVSANRLLSFKEQEFPGQSIRDLDGTASRGGLFEYRTVTTARYSNGPVQAGLTWRFYPKLRHADHAANPDTLNQGVGGSYSLFNLFGGYDFSDTVTLSGGIDNLLDRDPPIYGRTPTSQALGQTLTNVYDVLGRRYYMTLRLRF